MRNFFSALNTLNISQSFVPQNLLVWSEDFTQVWFGNGINVLPNTHIAPDGLMTASTINLQIPNGHNFRQLVNVEPNTLYTFSFFAMRGTAQDLRYSVYRVTTPQGNIVGQTSYYSLTNGSSFTRISIEFTTPIGCTEIWVYPIRDALSQGTFILWGAQLNEGPLRPYVKTEGTNIP